MACCRTIVGALGKKVKIIEFEFTADTTAFSAGDALYGETTSPIEITDVFDGDNGSGKVVSFSITQRHATTTTKKAVSAILFSKVPASTAVAINAAEGVSAVDFVNVTGILSIAGSEYSDTTFATEVISRAIQTAENNNLPIVQNDSTVSKRSLWIKLITNEIQTYSSSTLMNVKIVVECY